MEPIHADHPPSEDTPPNDNPSCAPSRHMESCYANRSAPRFKPYVLGRKVPTALEHRFMTKSILKRNEADISLIDVQQGKDIFKRGMMSMPDVTVHTAVMAKQANVESKRIHALAAAWELESAERHALLLQSVLRNYAKQYVENKTEASFFERLLVKRSRQQLEDDADFTIAAYSHDLTAHGIADEQLNQLEEIAAERKLDLPSDDEDEADAEFRLDECLNSILEEAKTAA